MLCQFCNSPFLCPECQATAFDDKESPIGIEFIAEFTPKVNIASGEDASIDLMDYLRQSDKGEDATPSYVAQL